jgi:hypothetical protein
LGPLDIVRPVGFAGEHVPEVRALINALVPQLVETHVLRLGQGQRIDPEDDLGLGREAVEAGGVQEAGDPVDLVHHGEHSDEALPRPDGTGENDLVDAVGGVADLHQVAPPRLVNVPSHVPHVVRFGKEHVRVHGRPLVIHGVEGFEAGSVTLLKRLDQLHHEGSLRGTQILKELQVSLLEGFHNGAKGLFVHGERLVRFPWLS